MHEIFSRAKEFDRDWIGNASLNQFGLHTMRMRFAAACNRWRYRNSDVQANGAEQLRKQGFIAIPNFLPKKDFARLKQETVSKVKAVEQKKPLPNNNSAGFGAKITRDWGFDRFDGGTLNRFIIIDHGKSSPITNFTNHPILNDLTQAVTGKPFKSYKSWIYQTIHGDDQRTPDLQKKLHRDTFFSSMKFWFFITPVSHADGPFCYVPNSSQLTKKRLHWEYQQSLAVTRDRSQDQSGSFRISEKELGLLGLPAPKTITVSENTLVIADTLGFHKRGKGTPGARRLAIYGNLRPHPFDLTL